MKTVDDLSVGMTHGFTQKWRTLPTVIETLDEDASMSRLLLRESLSEKDNFLGIIFVFFFLKTPPFSLKKIKHDLKFLINTSNNIESFLYFSP